MRSMGSLKALFDVNYGGMERLSNVPVSPKIVLGNVHGCKIYFRFGARFPR